MLVSGLLDHAPPHGSGALEAFHLAAAGTQREAHLQPGLERLGHTDPMPMAPEAGLEFPGRFYVWERGDGKTVLSYYKPSRGLGAYGNEMLAKMGQDMDRMWAMFAEEAAK